MSEFQLVLLIIGAIVVAAVYLYGLWQQWRYRRSLGREYSESLPVAAGKPLEAGADEALDERLAQDAGQASSQEPCVSPDDKADYVVTLYFKFPLTAQALDGFWQRRFDYGKPVQACGCNAASGNWERLVQESSASYSAVRIALLLVDRSGAISDTRLNDFRELLGEIGRKLDADMTLPLADAAIERARELDKFCSEVDQMIALNILPGGGRELFGSEVAQAMQQIGMSLQADGTFHQIGEGGATLFTLGAADGTPFQHHTLDQMRVGGLSLLLDIPRVGEPVRRFDEMTLLGMEIATLLRATLVDDQRVALGKAALAQIRAQVEAVEARMLAGDVAPGGAQALRLFS